MSPPQTTSDPELSTALAAIERAFAASPRPDKFTDPYCEECAEADEYFRNFTPVTIADVTLNLTRGRLATLPDPRETLPNRQTIVLSAN